MVNVFLVSIFLFNGLCVALINNDMKLPNRHLNPARGSLHDLQSKMKKMFNIDVNDIQKTNLEKKKSIPSNTDTSVESGPVETTMKFPEDFACLQACYTCVEDQSVIMVRLHFFVIKK